MNATANDHEPVPPTASSRIAAAATVVFLSVVGADEGRAATIIADGDPLLSALDARRADRSALSNGFEPADASARVHDEGSPTFDRVDLDIGATDAPPDAAGFVDFDPRALAVSGVIGLVSFENGSRVSATTTAMAAVPEPATMALLFAAFALLLRMSRRKGDRS